MRRWVYSSFNKKKLSVVKNKEVILQGVRNRQDDLWDIPIKQPNIMTHKYKTPTSHTGSYTNSVDNITVKQCKQFINNQQHQDRNSSEKIYQVSKLKSTNHKLAVIIRKKTDTPGSCDIPTCRMFLPRQTHMDTSDKRKSLHLMARTHPGTTSKKPPIESCKGTRQYAQTTTESTEHKNEGIIDFIYSDTGNNTPGSLSRISHTQHKKSPIRIHLNRQRRTQHRLPRPHRTVPNAIHPRG